MHGHAGRAEVALTSRDLNPARSAGTADASLARDLPIFVAMTPLLESAELGARPGSGAGPCLATRSPVTAMLIQHVSARGRRGTSSPPRCIKAAVTLSALMGYGGARYKGARE